MTRIRGIRNNFSGGIISKEVGGNVDIEQFNNSLEVCENMIKQATGGLSKRTGTLYLANFDNLNNDNYKLIPFPKKIAEKEKYAPILVQITEYYDRYVFSYVAENGEAPDISPLYVMKETGEIGVFFPPDYDDDYYNSGIDIPIPENI